MSDEHIEDGTLALGAWDPKVHEAIINLINSHGINSPNYDPERPPLAALDCDGTLICNDIGEAMLRFLDAQLLVEALEGSLEEVTVRLESGSTTMAFDLDNSLPMLQTELKAKREAIVSLIEKIVEDGIKDFIQRSEGENTVHAN